MNLLDFHHDLWNHLIAFNAPHPSCPMLQGINEEDVEFVTMFFIKGEAWDFGTSLNFIWEVGSLFLISFA